MPMCTDFSYPSITIDIHTYLTLLHYLQHSRHWLLDKELQWPLEMFILTVRGGGASEISGAGKPTEARQQNLYILFSYF